MIAAFALLGAGALLIYYRLTLDAAEIRRLNNKIQSLREINQSLHGRLDDILRARSDREEAAKNPLRVGFRLPALHARGWLNGDWPSPSELAGKVFVLDLWADW